MSLDKLDINDALKAVVRKQFEVIGASPDDVDFSDKADPQWYRRFTWTAEQRESMKEWLRKFLGKAENRRKLLAGHSAGRMNKRRFNQVWSEYKFMYGFREADDAR